MRSVLFKDNQLELFFSSLDKKKRYLLALSGGPDSTFLFHVLILYKISFIAAHVDHGWREESFLEASLLRKLCEEHGISFFCRSIDKKDWGEGDLENVAREARYAFFREICEQEGLSGVFVGHHADDKIETVLKRIFEGAGLASLSGPRELSYMFSIPVIRPLLHLRKQDIEDKLQRANISYFFDKTNLEDRFLRARMRKSIIPCIQKKFGKNIVAPLLALAKDSDELSEYINQESAVYFKEIFRSDAKVSITLPVALLQKPFLAKQVIKRFFVMEEMGVSRHTVLAVYQHVVQGTREVSMRVNGKSIDISRNTISIRES
ncbi:tRNA lysidine(34) synthetase TilS [Chlamydiifrater volucris]|uniref:tRNA lysidine(34) synthetase TilS n=1 Tax=Chlamydiifrater volucris TaxID=2681470 RepID=UPI001BD169EE|nr:tRNA lysidine(34) synthetase TilS [Chlamydiifrater volucris]